MFQFTVDLRGAMRAMAGALVQQAQRITKRPHETTMLLAMATRGALDCLPEADREQMRREILAELGLC